MDDNPPSEIADDVQLDSKLQSFILSQVSPFADRGCCGTFFPLPFERAAHKSWWDPTFDSDILEDQYKKSAHPHSTLRFRYALGYMILVSTSWLIYFTTTGILDNLHWWQLLCIIHSFLIVCMITTLCITYTRVFHHKQMLITLTIAILLALITLAFVVIVQPQPVGSFSICVQILLLIYTLIPLRLYMSLSLGIVYSIAFELVNSMVMKSPTEHSDTVYTLFLRILCHCAIHMIGFHIFLMSNVRMRHTFIKVGQSLFVRRQLELEKRLKENMIHSLMPSSVAHWLLHDDDTFIRRPSSDSSNDIQSIFRPFNMDHKENVSILFADIVGFTRMSTNKSAEQLVEILNDIFQRFDVLCKQHNCEKISTLGDCYYCVSGCPDAREDHAKCCVEMGLGMVQAIKQFDHEKNEGINIRVGVHTGTVLCGIVGTKRFKFDVWSNDVTLANRMESTGKPGMVHISEKTCAFLGDAYVLEEGEAVFGLKTYFILGRTDDRTPSYTGSFRQEGRAKYTNNLKLLVSPPVSSPAVSPMGRPRVASCNTVSRPSILNTNLLSPDVCKIKANSLPSILDIENEQDNGVVDGVGKGRVETRTSCASSNKLKKIKFLKFKRKRSTSQQNGEFEPSEIVTISMESGEDGYQQVPTIIETVSSNGNAMDQMLVDSIDIKSYISQSRNDISPFDYSGGTEFMRSSSYRSKYSRSPNEFYLQRANSNRSRRGRSPNSEILEPTERTRSATVAIGNLTRPKISLETVSQVHCVSMVDEQSFNNSRKDSGIKSNSRRSSIQQLENPSGLDPNQHRVSGYFTSSQSTVYSPQLPRLQTTFVDQFGGFQKLRKHSDLQLMKCVQENSKSGRSYFIKPPLSQITLFFTDKTMEHEFRTNVHAIKTDHQSIQTLAHSRFNTYLDMFMSILVFLFVSIGLFLFGGFTLVWILTFLVFAFIQTLGVAFCFTFVVRYTDKMFTCLTPFSRWNLFGAILVSLPMITVLVNFLPNPTMTHFDLHLYTYLLFVGVVHFCNFTQLNCWMKNILIMFLCLLFMGFFVVNNCDYNNSEFNSTATNNNNLYLTQCFLYKSDVLVNLFLLMILVWLLNREFEISYRLSFHANYVSTRDKIHVQRLKNQADYLIYNIVPEHVADELKKDAKYSENSKDVAIIFASIVNFNEMYDESFAGGKECLRVLNELIGDFDELLDRPEFQHVEKIKTIGSTFMAASGLNSSMRLQQSDPNEHLYALMDFALEMQNVVNEFNRDLLEFNLILRVGYNFGDVTAAVIGNTKLYYDIWGDAVNIASRMDSTGVNGRIQVGESCLEALSGRYEFEPRGYVYVKGKDNMNVYLLKRKKCPNQLSVPEMMHK